jgi:general stress protein 26
VNYIFHENHFFIATDYQTQKLNNIMHDSRVALIIDSYRPRGVIMIEGKATLIEKGLTFQKAYRLFHDKFAWVRRDPWTEGEAPFIEVAAEKKVSLGL